MSAYIGSVKGPHNNSPDDSFKVLASRGSVELVDLCDNQEIISMLDPIAARNLAALLVRAADEVERMRTTPMPQTHANVGASTLWYCDQGHAETAIYVGSPCWMCGTRQTQSEQKETP